MRALPQDDDEEPTMVLGNAKITLPKQPSSRTLPSRSCKRAVPFTPEELGETGRQLNMERRAWIVSECRWGGAEKNVGGVILLAHPLQRGKRGFGKRRRISCVLLR